MSEESFRFGQKSFTDDINFSRGFRKSGDFTLLEAEVLSLYGETMLSLEAGILEPLTLEENNFVRMLKQPQKAKTKLELVWIKYIKLTREPRRFHSLHSLHSLHSTSHKPKAEKTPVPVLAVESLQLLHA
ncbi:DUF413 domain-containing protein [Shewanella eurypsychrophilus]|uniref:Macrodomain Ori protein n=1 Tax=Shewanella eurypsychrophilus TaxID=2593656 RepID=A0ABX6VCD9_9GAMM|nr:MULTISPECIES: DUF413 domain-containing protein [Shewanella]QFU23997.1 DUF413 domain-containing protein [Shewanella sp. YLB-09]QPG59210.1 DUF413 domain-containing protein [Shewanella eurypsychrophilus]